MSPSKTEMSPQMVLINVQKLNQSEENKESL